MVWTQRPGRHGRRSRSAPLVFVGYGVTAPERGWDDFKGVDLKGKIAVFLINDPDFEAQARRAGGRQVRRQGGHLLRPLDLQVRGGRPPRRAGRPDRPRDRRRGLSAGRRSSPPTATATTWSAPTRPRSTRLLQGWIQRDLAVDLFKAAGLDFEAEKVRARTAGFKPVDAEGREPSPPTSRSRSTSLHSHNVLAAIPGAKRPNESVMFAAHWDAFGMGPPDATGDTVRHGAADDGIGVAGVLEIARAFAKGPKPAAHRRLRRLDRRGARPAGQRILRRSHPNFPLATTAANFTMDVVQTAGPSHDVVLVGSGQDSLEADLAEAAAQAGPHDHARPAPGEGALLPRRPLQRRQARRADRADHGHGRRPGPGEGRPRGRRRAGSTTTPPSCYHQVCDDWSARPGTCAAPPRTSTCSTRSAATSPTPPAGPTWNAGSEFKPLRDADRGAAEVAVVRRGLALVAGRGRCRAHHRRRRRPASPSPPSAPSWPARRRPGTAATRAPSRPPSRRTRSSSPSRRTPGGGVTPNGSSTLLRGHGPGPTLLRQVAAFHETPPSIASRSPPTGARPGSSAANGRASSTPSRPARPSARRPDRRWSSPPGRILSRGQVRDRRPLRR